MDLKIELAYDKKLEIKKLFLEYTQFLIKNDKNFDDFTCEMKRLYVKREYRGQKIASQLVDKIIDDAKIIGYKAILLDTLPFLQSAINLYKQKGFYEIPAYNNSPMSNSIFMKLKLE